MKSFLLYILLLCVCWGACQTATTYPKEIKVTTLAKDLKEELYSQEKNKQMPKYVIQLEEQLAERNWEEATATLAAMQKSPLNKFQEHYVNVRQGDLERLAISLKEEAATKAKAGPTIPTGDWWDTLSEPWKNKLRKGKGVEGEMNQTKLRRILDQSLLFEANPLEGFDDLEPLSALGKLQRISVNNNEVKTLEPLRELGDLRIVHAASNQISSIEPLRNNKSMQELYVADNKIEDIDILKEFKLLRELNITSNKVKDLSSLKNAVYLEKLIVNNNPITDLSPLSSLSSLQELYISHTNVTDLSPLEKLRNLRMLNISNTKISKLPRLENCKDIKQLICLNHQLDEGQLEAFKKAHPNCKVSAK